jgi:hypothetical protein
MSRPSFPINKKGSQLSQFRAVLETTGGLTKNVVPHRMTLPGSKPRYPPTHHRAKSEIESRLALRLVNRTRECAPLIMRVNNYHSH